MTERCVYWVIRVLAISSLVGLVGALAGCDRSDSSPSSNAGNGASADAPPVAVPNQLELSFIYGSEKKAWIDDATGTFNSAAKKLGNGKTIHVTAKAMGSGESIDEVITGRTQAHLISPASLAFVTLGNARWRAKNNTDLIVPVGASGNFDNLVVSPVVLAIWKPMAEALGWPGKPVGWAEVLELARSSDGWAKYGHPEWGPFKFGHTHPEYSNSGLISILAEAYAGAGKTRGLKLEDLESPQLGSYVADIERAVVHYGSSTGFFADRMFDGGPKYLSAAVMYESLVIDSYRRAKPTDFPVVAVYPKEGTFWSDHPVGLVAREWVTDEHREAAKIYTDFLRAEPQQRKAMRYGFRPGDTSIALASPIDAASGVDPKQPLTTLEVPRAEVVDGAVALWRKHKKRANVVVVFDTSGSMQDQQKMPNARDGAAALISLLDDEDTLSLLPFSDEPRWSGKGLAVKSARASAMNTVGGLVPGGGTALYDSVWQAYQYAMSQARPDKISAVVVLTDGEDTANRMTFDTLQKQLKASAETSGVRIFTIGYGSDARGDVLKAVSDDTGGKFYVGTPQNIREVFKEIATFF